MGFYPDNFNIYDQAFTHKSASKVQDNQLTGNNERLEFLGDAVLGAIVADYFFMKYPRKEEGFLSKMRSKIVNRNFLNQLAIDLGIDVFIDSSVNLRESKSVFGDAFEALIGAIYLDKGYRLCKKFVIEKIIQEYIDIDQLISKELNFKSKFIELAQQNKHPYDFKILMDETAQTKTFHCHLELNGKTVGIGRGKSKKKAEQMAAKAFFSSDKP